MVSFTRRSYSFRRFSQDLVNLIRDRTNIRHTQAELGEVFVRHIMLASTAINGCRYCSWGHVLSGMSSGEHYDVMESILDLSLDGIDARERPALQFAMAFAEKEGNIDRDDVRTLYRNYGEKAGSILTVTRMINFGNLSGNTIDAFQARLDGQQVDDGSVCLEFLLYVFAGTLFRNRMKDSRLYRTMRQRGILLGIRQ